MITYYSKSSGKGSNHAWIPSISSIGQPSYIVVQLYDQFGTQNRFKATLTLSSTNAYEHIKPGAFLRLLGSSLVSAPGSAAGHLQMSSDQDFANWQGIRRNLPAVLAASKKLTARKKKGEVDNEEDEDVGE